MGKASDVFRSPPSGPHVGRFMFLLILLIIVGGAMVAARKGLFTPARAPEPSAPAGPAQPAGGNALGVRVRADNDAVGLDLRGTQQVARPPDNVTTSLPSPDNNPFAGVRDGTGVTYQERDAYYRMVRKAWELRGENGSGTLNGVRGPGPIFSVPLLDRNTLLESPASWRGKVVRIRGSLVRVRPATYDPDPAQPDRPTLYYECCLKLVGEDLSIVHVFENPLDHGISPGGGVVYADAYFYKIWSYNDDRLQAPLLMGFRLVKEKADSTLAPTGFVLIGGFLAIVIVLWILMRRGSRQAEEMRDQLKKVPVDEIYIPEPKGLPRDKFYEKREKQTPPKTGG